MTCSCIWASHLLYYRYFTEASIQKNWVEEKKAETRDSASRGCGCRLYENCRMAECTPLDQPHCRTRLFSNAGSGKVIRDRLFPWRIARGEAQPLHPKNISKCSFRISIYHSPVKVDLLTELHDENTYAVSSTVLCLCFSPYVPGEIFVVVKLLSLA